MPTASEQVRKPWHQKRVWVKLHYAVSRKSIGAFCFWWFGQWYAYVEHGDIAAQEFLKSRGYRQLRGMWYAPKLEVHRVPDWKPTPKESSALAYLCDEWDHSYDLRKYRDVLITKRNQIADAIDKAATRGQRLSSQYLVAQLNRFAELVQTLS